MRERSLQEKSGTRQEVARRYGVAPGTLANLAWKKQGPRFYKVGRRSIYFYADVENWLRQNPVLTLDSVQG